MSVLAPTPQRAEVTTRDILLHAADILSEFDWRQGSAGSREEGSMCAVGAIWEATADLLASDARVDERVLDACYINGRPLNEGDLFPLAVWNDEPGRTKCEVVARLREAAG